VGRDSSVTSDSLHGNGAFCQAAWGLTASTPPSSRPQQSLSLPPAKEQKSTSFPHMPSDHNWTLSVAFVAGL
jgi:hypothetical protein